MDKSIADVSSECISMKIDSRESTSTQTSVADQDSHETVKSNNLSNDSNNCIHEPIDLVNTIVTHISNNQQQSSNECRPKAKRLLQYLMQSLLPVSNTHEPNQSNTNGSINHQLIWHLSQRLFSNNFFDWSKQVVSPELLLNCLCELSSSNEDVAQRMLSATIGTTSTENVTFQDYENKRTEPNDSISAKKAITNKMVQQLTNYLNDLRLIDSNSTKTLEKGKTNVHHVDVLILGLGLAGLGAATALSQASNTSKQISYIALEAQSSAGGRVKTVNLLDFSRQNVDFEQNQTITEQSKCVEVDGGAQWLHGRHNYLHELAEKYQLLAAHQSEEGLGSFLYENCIEVDEFLVKKIDFKIGELLSECELFARQQQASINDSFPKSVGHFLREKFAAFIESIDNVTDRQSACDLFDWHTRFQIIDNSCLSLDYVSAKYWGKYSFNGESCQAHYNFKNGFGSLVDRLIDELNEGCVQYNKEVTEIKINDKRTELNNNSNENSSMQNNAANISVKCADGSVYTANHVIVTFSLGVLKQKHEKLFQPQLPMPIRQAIESLGFETINKIFLEFETAWWNDLDGIQFLFKHNDHTKNADNRQWFRHMTGFDVMKPNHENVLLGWVGANGAIEMERLSDDQIVDDCVRLLSKFTNLNVPKPIGYHCTRWRSNPYICGAYSYISTDCDYNETTSENRLSQKLTLHDFYETPMYAVDEEAATTKHESNTVKKDAPIVLFAGEACHDKFFSTAHGAFLSGVEQSQKILEWNKHNKY